MLSARPRVTELRFNLFSRCVHPELFEICSSRDYQREAYRLRLDITRDGHLIQFQHGKTVLTEVNASTVQLLPNGGKLITHPIERSGVNRTDLDGIRYESSASLDCVDPQRIIEVEQMLRAASMECQGLVHRFDSNGRTAMGAISYMHALSFQHHVLVRSIHTFPDTFTVLTSESRFAVES